MYLTRKQSGSQHPHRNCYPNQTGNFSFQQELGYLPVHYLAGSPSVVLYTGQRGLKNPQNVQCNLLMITAKKYFMCNTYNILPCDLHTHTQTTQIDSNYCAKRITRDRHVHHQLVISAIHRVSSISRVYEETSEGDRGWATIDWEGTGPWGRGPVRWAGLGPWRLGCCRGYLLSLWR